MRLKRRVERTAASLFTLRPVQALTAVALAAGLVGGRRELILLSALVLATVGLARLWCRRGCRGLSLRASVSRNRLYPGEDYELAVRAENRQLLPMWVRAEVPEPGGPPPGGDPGEPPAPLLAGESGLLAFQRVHWQRTLNAAARGVYELGPILLEAGDPLGLFRRREERAVRLEVLVYPRRVPLAPLPLSLREIFGLRKAGTPVDDPACLAGTGDYQGGRPARHIHWKASARLDRLQEKLFEPTAQARLLILLDAASFGEAGGPGGGEAFERTLEAVASLILELDRTRVPVGLTANGVLRGAKAALLAPGRGPGQVARLLEVLARLTPGPGPGSPDPAREPPGGLAAGSLPLTGGTTCLYVCRRLAGSSERTIRLLRCRLHTPLRVLVSDPEGEAARLPAAGPPVIRLSELRPAPREDGRD